MFVIDPDTCTACDSCMDACPCDAISIVDGVHTIDPDLCVDCGACMDVCEFGSIPTLHRIKRPQPQDTAPAPNSLGTAPAPNAFGSAPTRHSARYQRFQREPPRPYREP